MTTSSKNTSVVLWFIIVRIGEMVRPGRSRMSKRKTDRPSVGFAHSSYGVVRARRTMRSE